MPITLNGSGTIAGISVGGLENGCVAEADLATAAVTNAKLASNSVTIDKLGTTEQRQLCKAWVNFNGTGTVAIRASFNVSSITDNGTGDYTVNFTTAMVDGNYVAVASGMRDIDGNTTPFNFSAYPTATYANAFTTASYRMQSRTTSNGAVGDAGTVIVSFFR